VIPTPLENVAEIQAADKAVGQYLATLLNTERCGLERGPALRDARRAVGKLYALLHAHEVVYGTSNIEPVGLLNRDDGAVTGLEPDSYMPRQ
jgi:hypothetical protein